MQYLSINAIVDKYFQENPNIESWGKEEVIKYQNDSVWSLICTLKDNNKYYSELLKDIDCKNMEELNFSSIPLLTKDMLRNNTWLLLSVDKAMLSLIHVSTGTTGGKPIYMGHTYNDLYKYDLAPRYNVLFNHYNNDDVVFIALPYEMSSSGLSFHRVFQCQEKAIVAPVGKGGHYSLPDKTLEMMLDLNISVLLTTPSYAILLAEYAEKLDISLKSAFKIKNIWLTGEGASNELRKRVENLWGCEAKTFYGTLECGSIGIECSEKNGYHINQGHVYVEIVDPVSKKILGPGEIGEVVVTTLLREGMPLLRYCTEDIGYIEDVPCECGIESPRLFLRGRLGDQIQIGSRDYSPFYFEECLLSNPEVGNWYKIIIHNEYLEIYAEPSDSNNMGADLEEYIASRFEFKSGVLCKFKFVEQIERSLGKNIRIIRGDRNDN